MVYRSLSKNSDYDVKQDCSQNADEYHGGKGKVDVEIFAFDVEVAGQAAEPWEEAGSDKD